MNGVGEHTDQAHRLAGPVSDPGMTHFDAAVRVLIYLHCTADRALTFAPNSDRGFEVFVDSSWLPKFSCSGAFFFYMGCPFFWF